MKERLCEKNNLEKRWTLQVCRRKWTHWKAFSLQVSQSRSSEESEQSLTPLQRSFRSTHSALAHLNSSGLQTADSSSIRCKVCATTTKNVCEWINYRNFTMLLIWQNHLSSYYRGIQPHRIHRHSLLCYRICTRSSNILIRRMWIHRDHSPKCLIKRVNEWNDRDIESKNQ